MPHELIALDIDLRVNSVDGKLVSRRDDIGSILRSQALSRRGLEPIDWLFWSLRRHLEADHWRCRLRRQE